MGRTMTRDAVQREMYERWGFAMVCYHARKTRRYNIMHDGVTVIGAGDSWDEAFAAAEATRARLEAHIGTTLIARKAAYVARVGEDNADAQWPTFSAEELAAVL